MPRRPFALDAASAPAVWLVETLWIVLASGIQTGNRLGFMEQAMGGGLGPPTHRHPDASEGFYVLEGTCTFNALGRSLKAGPGTFVHLPRLLPHSFSVDTAEARVLNFYTPACFEVMVMACGRPATELRRPTMPESAPPDSQQQIRILSDLYGQEAVTALPFLGPSTDELMRTESGTWSIGDLIVTTAADVEVEKAFGLEWRCLASTAQTLGTHDVFEVTGPVGSGQPVRVSSSDEAVYVLEGIATAVINGDEQPLARGSFAYLPAGVAAGWSIGEAAKLLIFHLPGSFDRALAGARGDDARLMEWLTADGTTFS